MKSIQSPFLTFKEEGHIYILQTAFPHYLGKVTHAVDATALVQLQLLGYHIFIDFAGTLGGNAILLNDNWKEQLKNVFQAMAEWYLKERVAIMLERFKKWKL